MPVPRPKPDAQTPEPEHINTREEDLAESYIIVAIQNDLEAAGYHVIRNGQRNAKRAGSGKDSPDLIITGGDIPLGDGKLLEVKVPHGWKYSSKEQRVACECGWVTRVHSVADARRAVGVK